MKLGCLLLLFLVILVAAIEAKPADIEVFDIEPESTPYEDYKEEPLLTGEETTTVESVETTFSTFIMEHFQSVRSIMMMVFLLVIFWATL